uniref:Methyltransferase domain-containing protein n=1 Tax=Panagrolaimus davidi TaxID=227884 RepID=A0A914QGN9_9BILA
MPGVKNHRRKIKAANIRFQEAKRAAGTATEPGDGHLNTAESAYAIAETKSKPGRKKILKEETNLVMTRQMASVLEAKETEKEEIRNRTQNSPHSTNSFEMDRRVLELKNKKAVEQRKMLNNGDKYLELYNILTPEAFCPNLIRLGRFGDGGKWICNPFALVELDHPCIFYSFGLNNEVSFEQELLNITSNKCKHIAIDAEKQEPSTLNALQTSTILQAKILSKTKNSTSDISFFDILKIFNTDYIDILKIDIEGWEHTIIDQLLSVPICQILIEIHDVHQGFTKPVVMKTHQNVYNFLHIASLKGFYLIHFEVNYRTLGASEFTLLHKSCFKNFDVNIVLGKYLS